MRLAGRPSLHRSGAANFLVLVETASASLSELAICHEVSGVAARSRPRSFGLNPLYAQHYHCVWVDIRLEEAYQIPRLQDRHKYISSMHIVFLVFVS